MPCFHSSLFFNTSMYHELHLFIPKPPMTIFVISRHFPCTQHSKHGRLADHDCVAIHASLLAHGEHQCALMSGHETLCYSCDMYGSRKRLLKRSSGHLVKVHGGDTAMVLCLDKRQSIAFREHRRLPSRVSIGAKSSKFCCLAVDLFATDLCSVAQHYVYRATDFTACSTRDTFPSAKPSVCRHV